MFMPELQPSGAFEWTQAAGGRALQCRPLLDYAPHLFTTRDLELRDSSAEWRAVAGAVGAGPDRLRLIRQVHGVGVAIVRADGDAPSVRPEADIVISDDPDTAIGVRVADCAPVLLADTRGGGVAAVHAGWRGTVQGAVGHAVVAMRDHLGSRPADLIAAIGPCLGACCGEVGPEVVEAFTQAGHARDAIARWFQPGRGDRSHLDLGLANRDQLADAGVLPDRIFDAGLCTKSHPTLFHSFRAHGAAAGRMAGVIKAGRRKKDEG